MASISSRWIIVLCLFLLSQQFAPVYTAYLSKNALVRSRRSEEQDEQDQEEQGESQVHHDEHKHANNAQKRGKLSFFSKWGWKGIKKTTSGAEKLSDIASISTTVLLAIDGCEGLELPGQNRYTIDESWEKHERLVGQYEAITSEIDSYILTAYNMRDSANFSYLMHNSVTEQIERLVDEQNYVFEAMNPRFKFIINNETYNLEQMIKKKKSNGEEVSLLEIDRGYMKGWDLALSLALPSLSLAMPYVPRLFKHLKGGVFGRRFKKKFKDTSLDIWETIEKFSGCDEKDRKAKEAVKEMETFIQKNKDLLEDAKSTVERTKEALKEIYGVAWHPDLLEALKMIKEMVDDTEISRPRPEATEISESIRAYLSGSLDFPDELFGLQDNLRKSLKLITYSVGCFQMKGTFISHVNDWCAEGKDTYEEAYDQYVGDSTYSEEKIANCKESSGELFITLDNMKQLWEKAAEKNCTVHKVCLMNNEDYVSGVKSAIMDGEEDVSKIAQLLFLQGHKGVNEEIGAIIRTLPSIDEMPLPDNLIKTICLLKNNFDAAEILENFKSFGVKRKVTKAQVEEVMKECPKKD
ncbi:uncharacterized protein LOC116308215 [Actinia tenebrosa]|uniref:Uncharacterized protein LOC116308215 n=1 Tax=Actinia tenebrosa TaxID=6105 RepID=A0A6P8J463_ACTTE|nr:uncharacterized protein LOC116308215 [Actinia tenebrosa]